MNIVLIKDESTWGCSNHSQVKKSVRRIDLNGTAALKAEKKIVVEKPYWEGEANEGDTVFVCTIDGDDKSSYETNIVSLLNGDAVLLVTKELDNIDNLISKIK